MREIYVKNFDSFLKEISKLGYEVSKYTLFGKNRATVLKSSTSKVGKLLRIKYIILDCAFHRKKKEYYFIFGELGDLDELDVLEFEDILKLFKVIEKHRIVNL